MDIMKLVIDYTQKYQRDLPDVLTVFPFSKKKYEKWLTMRGVELHLEYFRRLRHKIYPCPLCKKDWTDLSEFKKHYLLRCQGFTGSEKHKKALHVLGHSVLWKEKYNEVRELSEEIISGKEPFNVVPYCTCDTFKETQDCQCMRIKRHHMLPNLLCDLMEKYHDRCRKFGITYSELELMNTKEMGDSMIDFINANYTGETRESKLADAKRFIQKKEHKIQMRVRDDTIVINNMLPLSVAGDLLILGEQGRRNIDRIALNAAQIEAIVKKELEFAGVAYMLSRLWSDFNGVNIVDIARNQIQKGIEEMNCRKIEGGGQLFKKVYESIECAMVYLGLFGKWVHSKEYNNKKYTEESLQSVRQAISEAFSGYEKIYDDLLKPEAFPAETALKTAHHEMNGWIQKLPYGSPEVTKAIYNAIQSCTEYHFKTKNLADIFRTHARKKDFDRLGEYTNFSIASVLNKFKMPNYPMEEAMSKQLDESDFRLFGHC